MFHLGYIDPGSLYTVSSGLAAIIGFALSALAVVALFFRRLGAFIHRHWVWAVAVLVVAVTAIAVLLIGQTHKDGSVMAGHEQGKRLIIVALDGLSPKIIEPMMAAGKLPNFQHLKELGGYSHIGTTNPAESPVAWTSFATGRNPGKHGVYDFIRRNPASYLPDLSLTRLEGNKSLPVRRGKAFWQYGREAGVPMTILACPVTFPPDEINGKMLSGMGVPDLLGTQGTFSFYTTAPETVTNDTGGEVHAVAEANPLELELLGPQKQGLTGKVERLAAPFQVRVNADRTTATISLQGQEVTLAVGEWSRWLDVVFKAGPMSRMHGITRFNLVETKPYLKLYGAPICIDPRKPWFPISYPEGYAKEIAQDLGLYSTRGMPFDTWALRAWGLLLLLRVPRHHPAHVLALHRQGAPAVRPGRAAETGRDDRRLLPQDGCGRRGGPRRAAQRRHADRAVGPRLHHVPARRARGLVAARAGVPGAQGPDGDRRRSTLPGRGLVEDPRLRARLRRDLRQHHRARAGGDRGRWRRQGSPQARDRRQARRLDRPEDRDADRAQGLPQPGDLPRA
jgi:hypothetical protein